MRVGNGKNHLTAASDPQPVRHRALFLSDIHLGTRAAQADALLEFLKHHEADVIYLVGDIIDFWRVKRGPVWPQSHNDVLQKLLRKVRKGTRIVFIPGNHDEALRDYCGMWFGGIEIHRDVVHIAADGRRYLVMHGDEFDVIVRYAKWLAFLGDRSYEFALWCNHPLNWLRRRLGFGYWSLSAYLKLRVKSAVNFIGEFENALAEEARRRHVNGVICGHIHHAADRAIDGIRYLNCGDWVESCTALAEDEHGRIRLIRWNDALTARHTAATLPDVVPEPAFPALLADIPTSAIGPAQPEWSKNSLHEGRAD
jgi:UDP-2,3-diacylglucosamine pyrophosphatase LpxH